MLLRTVHRTAASAQALALAALPHGGQRGARRNAWAGMSADAAMARARREADTAIRVAAAQHQDALHLDAQHCAQ